jgi:HNH endonuclease
LFSSVHQSWPEPLPERRLDAFSTGESAPRLPQAGDAIEARRLDGNKLPSAEPGNPRSMFPCHLDELEQLAKIHSDVWVARELDLDLLKRDRLFCVWTGKKLKKDSLDIDHCFRWSASPSGDLWNLLAALRSVNQNQKSDRLPSAERLTKAKEFIVD